MKFTIDAETIQELIKTHVSALIEIKDGVELDVEYDDEGNADVSLVLATATKPAPKKRGPKPKATKKPEPVKEEVQEELPLEEEPEMAQEEEAIDSDVHTKEEEPVVEAKVEEKPAPKRGNLFANVKRPS